MHKVLLVDDDENILLGYRRNLRGKFNLLLANGPAEALKTIDEHADIAVVLTDYNMPEMNGIELLSKIKTKQPDTVRILITGYADLQMAINSVNEGNIFRFLTKPCNLDLLQNIIQQGVDQYKLIVAEKELLENTLKGSLKVLIDILAVTNPTIFNRSILIKEFAKKLLKRLNISETWEIDVACLLSQIGCVGVPNEILEKKFKGTPLTKEEEEMFFSQAEIGKSLLKNIPRLEKIADAISMQYKSANDINLLKDAVSDETLMLIPKILRLLNDYYMLLDRGISENKIIDYILEERFNYDPLLLSVLEAELMGAQEGYVFQFLQLKELKEGMVLAADLFDKTNTKILSKGIVFSDIYIAKMMNFAKVKGIQEPIKVLVKT